MLSLRRERTLEFKFENPLFEWRGPAPFFFVKIEEDMSADMKIAAKGLSYGWGVLPATATIGKTTWTTALFPKDGCYLLPVKDAVREAEGIEEDQIVKVKMSLGKKAT
jgi:hypothetical protein